MFFQEILHFILTESPCFYRLGNGNKSKGILSGVNTYTFNIDEHAMRISPSLMLWLAMNWLGCMQYS